MDLFVRMRALVLQSTVQHDGTWSGHGWLHDRYAQGLFRYPCHLRVTAIARKDPSRSAESVGGRLQLSTHAPYVCGFA